MWDHELEIAKFEEALNKSMDNYFNARPQLSRTVKEEKIFEAGFRMAWAYSDLAKKQ